MSGNLFTQSDSISIRSGDLPAAEKGIRVIVVLEVAGVLLAMARFMTNSYVSGDLLASVPSIFLLAVDIALIAYAAPKLWRFEPQGFKLMFWVLGLQLICILGPRVSYANYFPCIAWVGFLKQGMDVQIFGLGFDGIALLRFSSESIEMPNAVGINLWAIALMILTRKLRLVRERTLAATSHPESLNGPADRPIDGR